MQHSTYQAFGLPLSRPFAESDGLPWSQHHHKCLPWSCRRSPESRPNDNNLTAYVLANMIHLPAHSSSSNRNIYNQSAIITQTNERITLYKRSKSPLQISGLPAVTCPVHRQTAGGRDFVHDTQQEIEIFPVVDKGNDNIGRMTSPAKSMY